MLEESHDSFVKAKWYSVYRKNHKFSINYMAKNGYILWQVTI